MDYRRAKGCGGTYFFTVVTEKRRPLLVKEIERLRSAFRYVKSKRPFHIEAIVVLPDHLHTIWTLPAGDCDYSGRWSLLKRHFSTQLPASPSNDSQRKKREKGIWQRRFWEHQICDENDLRNHLDYVHYNPVKHGHVQNVIDWPHSSFHRFVQNGWYEKEWGYGDTVEQVVKEMDLE